ncbi:hypothetical protein [Erythrobacter sp.]|uniref:hypothetical protein n=1 Tax=Erythrobacter sp. TaxID=1042 RepID=UPI001425FBB6|nr:hypothetical protein [Erythrobacter sp.]QIQ87557.1 MAG: hypothetical protein G9473_13340 [Erythrobacter sp.]
MRFQTFALATAAVSLAAAPAVAQTAFERSIAPVEGESELAGSSLVLALLGAAAVIGGIIIIADDDDDNAVSP